MTAFDLYPAIDLKGGQCVRLRQGEMHAAEVYGNDPVEMARRWADAGAGWLHIVDLDGAVGGAPANRMAIGKVLSAMTGVKAQVGGGIRSLEQMTWYLERGAARVVLGTSAIERPELLRDAVARFAGRIVVSLDSRDGQLYVDGWTRPAGRRVDETARWLAGLGVTQLVLTDISRDGMLGGVDLARLRALIEPLPLPVIVAGGVSSLEDLAGLKRLPNVNGAIIGKALYTHAIDLKLALQAVRG